MWRTISRWKDLYVVFVPFLQVCIFVILADPLISYYIKEVLI